MRLTTSATAGSDPTAVFKALSRRVTVVLGCEIYLRNEMVVYFGPSSHRNHRLHRTELAAELAG